MKRLYLYLFLLLSFSLLGATQKPRTFYAAACVGSGCRGYFYYEKGCWMSWIAARSYAWGTYGQVEVRIPYSAACQSNWSELKVHIPNNCPNSGVVKAQEAVYPYYSEARYPRLYIGCFGTGYLTWSRMVSGQVPVHGWAGLSRSSIAFRHRRR